jgi:hypothetical protein
MLHTRRNLTILVLLTSDLLGCNAGKGAADAEKAKDNEYGIEFTRELVTRKAKEVFPKEDISKIMGILDQYGVRPHEQERERVQLAILKLSGGELEELQKQVRVAKSDYRDVLVFAEYPLWFQSPKPLEDTPESKEIREKDRKQYLDWLKGNPPSENDDA